MSEEFTKQDALDLHTTIKTAVNLTGGSAKLVDALVGSANPKQKRQSRHLKKMTYYRERFALQIKTIIDEMIVEFAAGKYEDRVFAYDAYDGILSKNSLYLKVSQSWLYARKELDADGKYADFAEVIRIKRGKDGIRITYERDITESTAADLVANKVIPDGDQQSVIRNTIDTFLEDSNVGEELNMNKLSMTQEQVDNIDASLIQLDNITYKIFANKIWIVKIA